MNRTLTLGIALAWISPRDVVAQNFQFMKLPAEGRATSVLPLQAGISGYIEADDFDGNGQLDLLVTSPSGATLFQGTSSGWTTTPIPCSTQRPRLVDLDGDGDRDLVFVPPDVATWTTALVYQNTPSGMTPVTLPPGMDTARVPGVAVGDIDGNGIADLVVAAPTGSVVPSLVLVRGAPGLVYTFDMTSMPTGLPYGLGLELIDADGDGDLDVLATHATSGLRLLLNVGGTFVDGTASLPPTFTGHRKLTAADYDGDGRTDCACALTNALGAVHMLWGGPTGLTFANAAPLVQHLRGVWPADFDGDGDLDILADTVFGVDVLWNLGNRQFLQRDLLDHSVIARGTADVNADGEADLLFATISDDRMLRCRFSGMREAGMSTVDLPGYGAPLLTPTCAGDIDGDGRSDLVAAQLDAVIFDRALGGGLYDRSYQYLPGANAWVPWRMVAADMDGDGDLDFVVRDDTSLAIFDQNSAGTFVWSQLGLATNPGRDDLRVADVDADGDLDIVHESPSGAALTRNLGGGQYGAAVVLASPARTYCLDLADADGDGDADLFAAGVGSHTAILANDGAGNFAPQAALQFPAVGDPTSLRAGDVDGDGDQDLVVLAATPHLLRNDGSGSFTDTTATDLPFSTQATVSNIVLADLDEDADLDIALAQQSGSLLTVLINDGTGLFSDRSAARVQPIAASTTTWHLRAGDIDDDGDIDLVAGRLGGQHVFVNHVRHCRAVTALRLGGTAEFHVYSGPGFGQPSFALFGVGFALASPPVPFAGIAGQLELDPTTLQILACVMTSPIGVQSVFVSVPMDAALFGLEVWFQGAIRPSVGQPGFTNAVYEVVLR